MSANKPIIIIILTMCMAFCTESTIAQDKKPRVSYGPMSTQHVPQHDLNALDSSLVNFLYAINTNTFEDCFSVDFDYLKTQVNPFPYLMDAQKSGRYNDLWFFEPVVSYAVPLGDDSYNIKIAFIGRDPDAETSMLRLIHSLIAKKTGDIFRFYSPLETVKAEWDSQTIGNITFYYDGILNREVATDFAEFNMALAKKFETEVIDVSYFKCRDGRELFYIIGCDYINNAYFAKTGGLAEPWRNHIFAGNNSESYPHELVHLYTAKKFGPSRNYIADEGYCTYIGGSGELTLDELVQQLNTHTDHNPDADIFEMFVSDVLINNEFSTVYILSGLFMRMIEETHGMEGIQRAITAENGLSGYLEILDEYLGINERNFSEKTKHLLTHAY